MQFLHINHFRCSIPEDLSVSSWRLNLTFRWIVNHQASSLACGSDAIDYRPVHLPAFPFPTHLEGVTFQPKALQVRSERMFSPGSVVTIVDGLLTKSPTATELGQRILVQLLDFWYLIPTTTIPRSSDLKFWRGLPPGSFVQQATRAEEANVVFSHLTEDCQRVWMRCRETSRHHFIRPIALISLKYIDRKEYVKSKNALTSVLTLSSHDLQRLSKAGHINQEPVPDSTLCGSTIPASDAEIEHISKPLIPLSDVCLDSIASQSVTDCCSNEFETPVICRPHLSRQCLHAASKSPHLGELEEVNELPISVSTPQPVPGCSVDADAVKLFDGGLNIQSREIVDGTSTTVANPPTQLNSADRSNNNPTAVPTLLESTRILLLNHMTHVPLSLFESNVAEDVVQLSALNEGLALQNDRQSECSDPVDFEVDDLEEHDVARESQVPLEFAHAESVVNSWNDHDIRGFKILRNDDDIRNSLLRVFTHFFDGVTCEPKAGLFWSDLFSQDVEPVEIIEPQSGLVFTEFVRSTRAHVPLFDWTRNHGVGKFEKFPLRDDAVQDIKSFEDIVCSVVMPRLGFDSEAVSFVVEGMSFLIQSPCGGVSQVIHTDDYPDCHRGEWVSLIFPCHNQRATVFLRKVLSNAFGTPAGVKPFLGLGDFAAWSGVHHFGSGSEAVSPEKVIRVALFVFVHVISKQPLDKTSSVPDDVVHGNRNVEGEEEIHFGPDVTHWRTGLVPITRVCVCCNHGVNSGDVGQSNDSSSTSGTSSEYHLLFCKLCSENAIVSQLIGSDSEARVRSLVCQWCAGLDSFDFKKRYPLINTGLDTVVDFLYHSVLDAKLCTHGRAYFTPLPISDHLFVIFSHDEVASGCNFWLDFFATYSFTKSTAPSDVLKDGNQWVLFWDTYIANSTCARARLLCWLGSIIAGIGPVFTKKPRPSHGGYPVFYNTNSFDRNLVSATNSFVNMQRSLVNATKFVYNDTHLIKATRRFHGYIQQSYWEYSFRCKCHCIDENSSVSSSPSHNHRIVKCPGPRLNMQVVPRIPTEAAELSAAEEFVLKCRRLWQLESVGVP